MDEETPKNGMPMTPATRQAKCVQAEVGQDVDFVTHPTNPHPHSCMLRNSGDRSLRSSFAFAGRVRGRSQSRQLSSASPAHVDPEVDVQPKRPRTRAPTIDLGDRPETIQVEARFLGPTLQRRFAHLCRPDNG